MLKNKTLLYVVKIVVSLSLLLIIIFNIKWDEVTKNIIGVNYFFLFVAFSLSILERLELTYKWNQLIRVRGITISFFRLLLINLIGGFIGLFLPSSLGTDVVRGYYLVKNNGEKTVSVSSIVLDRLLGVLALFILAVLSIIVAGDLISRLNINLYIILLSVVVFILVYLFQREETAKLLERFLKIIKYKRLGEIIISLHKSVLEYKKYPKTLLAAFLITILVQVTRVLTFYFIALAFNISVPVIYFFLFIPIIMLVIMIPISIGGLGVGEGTFIAFFTLAGISLNDSVSMAFTSSIFNILFTLLGGLAYLFYKSPLKKEFVLSADSELLQENVK